MTKPYAFQLLHAQHGMCALIFKYTNIQAKDGSSGSILVFYSQEIVVPNISRCNSIHFWINKYMFECKAHNGRN